MMTRFFESQIEMHGMKKNFLKHELCVNSYGWKVLQLYKH